MNQKLFVTYGLALKNQTNYLCPKGFFEMQKTDISTMEYIIGIGIISAGFFAWVYMLIQTLVTVKDLI